MDSVVTASFSKDHRPTRRCCFWWMPVVAGLATVTLPACNRDPSGANGTPQVSPVVVPERELNAALTDELARELRVILHPSGNGGAMSSKRVECRASDCTATFDVAWTGGLTGAAYVSTVAWTVSADLSSTAKLDKETSVFKADAEHTAKMLAHLQDLARRLRGGSAPDLKTASSAALAQAAPAGAGEGVARSRLDELAAKGASPSTFWKVHRDDLWAITASGETDCEGHSVATPVAASDATAKMDQFERREAEQKANQDLADRRKRAAEIAAELKGQVVSHRFHGRVKPEDLKADDGPLGKEYEPEKTSDGDEFPFLVYLSEYDFASRSYTMLITAKADGRWPLGAEAPSIESRHQSATMGTTEHTGVSVGGKEVTLRGTTELGFFQVTNRARLKLNLKMGEAEARAIAKGADVDVLILEQPTAARYNKACRRESVSGVAFVENDGIGFVFAAKTIGYQVRVNGTIVAAQGPS